MSDKYFFKGRRTPKPAYGESGYNTKRATKPGTEISPLLLSVQTEARKVEVAAIVAEQQLFANITVDADKAENIIELTGLLNKPKAVSFEAKPNRNDVCSCGSGKKYKKCCGA
ncbi:PBPRA1643 family SWIM/SEC-C metal-binding motif protein [Shewanella sp. HL-SH8]|jgi:SWIM/SEC-C metal-binding protein|uniref:PBPRA1643 family SWIM/SEC-C metal-binding motif protein n=1 Tax=Shewanella TaxID=22 RepID=UPI001CF8483C|nr:PBPRA1643 family SWIM/SEC-C metal-binding motif protein [Shewanella glacialimarina]UCX05694.1 zinc chelation protein SecC [Shewanella glacialimarina]